jgi:hypothetical protein
MPVVYGNSKSSGRHLEAEDLLAQRRTELSPEVVEYIETSSTVQHEKARLARGAAPDPIR